MKTTIFKAALAVALLIAVGAGVIAATSTVADAQEQKKTVKIDVAKYQAWPYANR